MFAVNKLSLCFLLALVDVSSSYGAFPVRYIGNYLTVDDYKNLTFCDSKLCLMDAERLISDASYDININPCGNFKNFSCGTFLQERAVNERYENAGFAKDFEISNNEKRHRVLKAAIDKNDGKAIKVVKNFYQKCINWREFINV